MSTPEEMAAAIQLIATSATREDGNDSPSRESQVQSVTLTSLQKLPGAVRVRRRSDEVRGSVVQTEIILGSRGPAVSAGTDDDRSIVNTETQRDAQQ